MELQNASEYVKKELFRDVRFKHCFKIVSISFFSIWFFYSIIALIYSLIISLQFNEYYLLYFKFTFDSFTALLPLYFVSLFLFFLAIKTKDEFCLPMRFLLKNRVFTEEEQEIYFKVVEELGLKKEEINVLISHYSKKLKLQFGNKIVMLYALKAAITYLKDNENNDYNLKIIETYFKK